jgi:hypothetical protein
MPSTFRSDREKASWNLRTKPLRGVSALPYVHVWTIVLSLMCLGTIGYHNRSFPKGLSNVPESQQDQCLSSPQFPSQRDKDLPELQPECPH